MRKLFAILCFIIVYSSSVSFAQLLHTKPYFDKLETSLATYCPADDVVMDYCNNYEKNINPLFVHDNKIKLGNEEYSLNEISLDYYNGFQSLSFRSKCRLVYSWAAIRPVIYEEIKKNNSFNSLGMLPIAISAMNKFYCDEAGGFGLWGLQYIPAVRYGIVADTCYDERLDLVKSSNAAIQYLHFLHRSFGSWDYAITAYVCGPAKLRKAMTGTANFDSAIKNLDSPAKNTFYIFLSVLRWLEENETVITADVFAENQLNSDTVIINCRIHFSQIAEVLQIDNKELLKLNPLFVGNVIDGREKPKTVFLPRNYKKSFLELQDSIIHFKDSIYFPEYKPVEKQESDNDTYYADTYVSVSPGDGYEEIKYKIVSGDNLGFIAEKYGVKVSDLQDWNNISGTNIYAGQQISIWVKKGTAANYTKTETEKKPVKTETVKVQPDKKESSTSQKAFEPKEYTLVGTYVVKSGDSAYKIAQNYSWATPEDILSWNNITDPSKLQVGQKLKIYKKK